MKIPAFLIFIVTLGLGIAVGSYFAPEVQHFGVFFKLAPDESSGVLSGNSDSSATVKNYHSASGTSPVTDHGSDELSSCINETNSFLRTKDLLSFIQSVPPEDIPNVISEIQKHSGNGKDQALTLIVGRWVDIDPQGAKAAISTIQDSQVRFQLTHAVFSALAAQDSSDALRQAQELPNQQMRDEAILDVVKQVAQQDPAQALALFQNARFYYGGAIGAIFNKWADKDLDQATQAALRLPNAQDRTGAIVSMVVRLVQKDPQLAMSWLEQIPPGDAQNQARENLVARVAINDPQAAADYVHSLQQVPSDVEIDLIQNVAMYWSNSDPKAAVLWATSLPPSQSSKNAVEITLTSWAKNDPKAALDLLNTLPQNVREQNSLMENFASRWAQSDPQAAVAWANQLPAGEAKDGALRSAISQWAGNEPTKAAAYTQSMPPGPVRDDVIGMVADAWSENDPVSAAQWVSTLPDNRQKNGIYANLARTWAKNDPVAASSWLGQLPSGPGRDTAITQFTNQVVASDPNSAYQWAESIGDSNARQQQVLSVLQNWHQYDPANANAAIQNSTLSPEQKNRLLQSN